MDSIDSTFVGLGADQKTSADLKTKSRFLFIVNVDWFFVSHRLPIAEALIDQGHEVHIATHITDKLALLEKAGIVVHPVPIERGSMNILSLYFYFLALLRLIYKLQPDLVHLVTIKSVLFGGIAARMVAVPSVVAAISGLGSTFLKKGFFPRMRLKAIVLLYQIALKQKKLKVIFQNKSDWKILQTYTGLKDDQIVMIRGSGVDLKLYRPQPADNDRPIVLFAARLIHEKGVSNFIEAARIIRDNHTAITTPRFVLVGAPDVENPSSVSGKEIEEWEKEGIIEYWGHRSDMPDVLAQTDLVVFPSYYGEGLPKILVEAAASGRAVITTDHPGCRDAIENQRTGLLVPVKDSKALSKAINTLLKDKVRREAMGKAGRDLTEKAFDINFVIQQHLEIYDTSLQVGKLFTRRPK